MSPQEQAVLTLAREAAHGILRRWKLIFGVYLGIVLVSVSGIFVLPPIYRTAGKILLTTDRAEVSAGDKAPSLVRTDEVSEGEINSQVQILKSRELIDQVLADMKPPKDDDDDVPSDSRVARILHAPASFIRTAYKRLHKIDNLKPGSPLYWQTRDVLDRLDASNAHPSNIIDVGYVSSDPAVGAGLRQPIDEGLRRASREDAADLGGPGLLQRSRARSCGRSWRPRKVTCGRLASAREPWRASRPRCTSA